MPLKRLRVDGVRCLDGIDCKLDPVWNLFVGPNGAGKTSLLESIFLLGRGRSFRTRHTHRLVRHGTSGFVVAAEVGSGGRTRRIGLSFADRSLEIRMDGEPRRSMVELAEALVVNVLDPKLHELIEAGPSARRRFLDGAVFHVEHRYLDAWRAYRKVLGQRNAALRQGSGEALLAPWDRSLVAAGARMDRFRQDYVADLGRLAADTAGRLLGRPVGVEYRAGWPRDASFEAALTESREQDRERGYTLYGPHRGDLDIRLESYGVRDEASRGQQKLIAASLVLAHVRLMGNRGHADSVLLVDDPAAELDRASLRNLVEELREVPAQVIMTALSGDHLDTPKDAAVFHVKQGRIEPVL